MGAITSKELLDDVIRQNEQMIALAKAEFVILSDEQLNWKPAAKKWSIAECLEHLSRANSIYIRNIDKVYNKLSSRQKEPETEFRSTLMGKWAADKMRPKKGGGITFKMSTFKSMEPITSDGGIGHQIIEEFFSVQQKLITQMEQARQLSLNRTKVQTDLGPLVKLKLGDTFLFLTAHNERHMLQAQNVKAVLPGVAMA